MYLEPPPGKVEKHCFYLWGPSAWQGLAKGTPVPALPSGASYHPCALARVQRTRLSAHAFAINCQVPNYRRSL